MEHARFDQYARVKISTTTCKKNNKGSTKNGEVRQKPARERERERERERKEQKKGQERGKTKKKPLRIATKDEGWPSQWS